jgi:5-methylcytosine-specific restriction endonuclease McrA
MTKCSRCKKNFDTESKNVNENYKTCIDCRNAGKETRQNIPRTYKQGDFSSKNGITKKCNICLEIKNLELFYKHHRYKDGYRNNCIICHSIEWKKYYNKTYHSVLKEKLKVDNIYRLKQNVKSYIHIQLKNNDKKKSDSSVKYIGCSIPQLYIWLKYSNPKYDTGIEEFQIDHVIPLSLFDLNNQEEIDISFHWTNLQILSKKENLTKYNKFNPIEYFNHIIIIHKFIDLTTKDFDSIKKNLKYIKNTKKFCNTFKLRGPP